MSPHVVACYTQKSYRFFAQSHAAPTSQKPCFRRLKEDGENGELPPEREVRYQTNILPRSFRLRMTAIFYPPTIPFSSYYGITSEAASLRAFGPYGQKAHNLGGIYKGGVPPSYAFSLGFGVAETAFHLTRVKEMNNNLPTDRKLCSHYLPPSPPSPTPPHIEKENSYEKIFSVPPFALPHPLPECLLQRILLSRAFPPDRHGRRFHPSLPH